jgi:predicted Zn-dependent peptidase
MLHKTILENQLAVITLERPGAHSCALGLWLENGSRHQRPQQNGYAHLLEHLLVRGDAALLAEFEALGGQINGHCGRELTTWYGVVPAARGDRLLQFFAGRLSDLQLSEHAFASERQVVLQELASFAGSREALQEHALAAVWPAQPIGWPLLGDAGVLQTATLSALQTYLHELCVGSRLAVVAVGAVDHERLLENCADLGRFASGQRPQLLPPRYDHQARQPFIYRHGEQAIVQWLLPAPAAIQTDNTYAALLLADHILGGGMSSRLYRSLRERHGLSYAVGSALEFYSDTTLWNIQLDCPVIHIEQCIALVQQEIQALIAARPATAELELARRYLAAHLQIMQDDHLSTMQRLGREHFYFGLHPDADDYTHSLDKINGDDICRVLAGAWRAIDS